MERIGLESTTAPYAALIPPLDSRPRECDLLIHPICLTSGLCNFVGLNHDP